MPEDLVITRVFDAPRRLLFDAWTKEEHLQHWQGAPEGFTTTTEKSDIRPGGGFQIRMRSADGAERRLRGEYKEITPPQRIVFTHTWLDARGTAGPQTLVTVTFAERAGKTELTLRQSGLPSVESREGHSHGWESALNGLAAYLATQTAMK